ncbi:hypothetical protein VTJ49DRAFT_4051 [Mycothermus thermophilus]|uniref:Uncharacterized protein n=1 Tax=Humicola insolens TaxID=85995 RepID=A0ABR3V6A8_HUMIN
MQLTSSLAPLLLAGPGACLPGDPKDCGLATTTTTLVTSVVPTGDIATSAPAPTVEAAVAEDEEASERDEETVVNVDESAKDLVLDEDVSSSMARRQFRGRPPVRPPPRPPVRPPPRPPARAPARRPGGRLGGFGRGKGRVGGFGGGRGRAGGFGRGKGKGRFRA